MSLNVTKIILAIISISFTSPFTSAEERPNVVFLLSDDQGWSDYSFMNHPHIKTPNIDALAAKGITYERGYVTAPLCRPSLASLVTGLYPRQTGIRGNDPLGYKKLSVDAKITTRNQMTTPMNSKPSFIKELQKGGYATLQTGKWWEGNPLDHGFNKAMTHGDVNKGARHGDQGLKIGRETMKPIYDFVEQSTNDNKPFFIWYGVFLPHTPHNAPKYLFDKYKDVAPNVPTAWYWANCEWLDITCGELINHLKEKGLYENTIFVYSCDNGWRQNANRRNKDDSKSKRQPTEMGIRTPIIITHHNKIVPTYNKTTLASNIDIAPTILKACNLPVPSSMIGLDLRDLEALEARNRVFVEVYEHDQDLDKIANTNDRLQARVVINGWDKLTLRSDKAEYYNLKQDIDDLNNLADEYPEKVKELTGYISKWLESDETLDLTE